MAVTVGYVSSYYSESYEYKYVTSLSLDDEKARSEGQNGRFVQGNLLLYN